MDKPSPVRPTASGDHAPMVLDVEHVGKAYGATKALVDVSFRAESGELLAVLGENGAGKSTLMKVLSGIVRPSTGQVTLGDEPLQFRHAREALRAGIVLIPQELSYAPDLSVAENILLGQTGPLSTTGSLERRARPFAERVGLEVGLRTKMRSLSIGQQQLVEIAKALARRARVLLLDEPTAALTSREAEILFDVVGQLKASGVVCILISHRLDEVMAHADRILILRDGHRASFGPLGGRTKEELGHDMLGFDLARERDELGAPRPQGGTAVQLRGVMSLRGLSAPLELSIRSGAITCLFGIRGAGHDAVIEMLAGLNPHTTGTIEIDARTVRPLRSVRRAYRHGVSYVPPDRKKSGLVLHASISRNMTLSALDRVTRAGFVFPRKEAELARSMAAVTSLKYRSIGQAVSELSGGNQQKVLIGAHLAQNSTLLLLHEPTRGVDLGARAQIHDVVRRLAAEKGAAVVIATTDVDEAVELAHVAHIFRDGALCDTVRGDRLNRETLLITAQTG